MGLDTVVAPNANGQQTKEPSREFVDAKQYVSLAISNRTLVRLDDKVNCLRGLHDPDLGITYVIHEEKLFGERNFRAAESGF